MRLLIFLGLVYFCFKAFKSFMVKHVYSGKIHSSKPQSEIDDDIMVQDPVCKVYFPKREGIYARIGGEDFYFCSTACRDAYLENKQ